jgi:hypothetical protein
LQYHLVGQIDLARALIEMCILAMVIYLLYRRTWFRYLVAVLYIAAGVLVSTYALFKYKYLLNRGSDWTTHDAIQVAIALTIILISVYVLVLIYHLLRYFRTAKVVQRDNDTELTEEYIAAAKLWEKRLQTTDNVTVIEAGEKAFDKNLIIFNEIKRRDPNVRILIPMLKHANNEIRILAARHLFGHIENEPQKVFEEIASQSGGLGRSAKAVLKALQDGELDVA